jgi:hypothetical protein
MKPECGQPRCRAYELTVAQFERLGGETWTQAFRVQLGLRASRLHEQLLGKKAAKLRARGRPGWRNKVGKYPCGILEQAYRELRRGSRLADAPR